MSPVASDPSTRSLELPADLPEPVRYALTDFCTAAQAAFGGDLESIVLFGSAAEGRLRATSDVNVLVVLKRFEQPQADRVREATRLAFAAVKLRPMFVLLDELPLAAEAFAVKFQDILTRRAVIAGRDPFAGLTIPRERIIHRVRQVLLNTAIRLRATYALVSLREEQLAREIAEAAAPLRSSAVAILTLEGRRANSPKSALAAICTDLPGGPWNDVLLGISDARDDGALAPGVAPALLMRIIELATTMRERAARIAS